MRLREAERLIRQLEYVPFEEYLHPEDFDCIVRNKGKTGQILERFIGLSLSNTTLDFEDGELKTNKCDQYGKPLETMFITQTSSTIDDLLNMNDFYSSKLYKKIRNLLYVPISKEGSPSEWMFLPCIHIDLSLPKYYDLRKQLEDDYYNICEQLNKQLLLSNSATLHTVNGRFIQIRTKDNKPYHPIYSEIYGRQISDKNRAFYFKKEFMKYITEIN